MKVVAASTFILASLALANPAPVAQPESDVAAVAQPKFIAAREPNALERPHLDIRAKKPKTGSSNSSSAADTLTVSRALQLGAIGLGAIEVVRLCG